MAHLIDKAALVAEIKKRISRNKERKEWEDIPEKRHQLIIEGQLLGELKHFLDTLEVKNVDLIIHTIIAECCDWLATNTNLSHDEIEGCRNLMLTVKEEQFKAQKGEEL